MASTPPEHATTQTVEPEWWSGAQLAAHLGYDRTNAANRWFRRHLEAGHFEDYEEPRRSRTANRSEDVDARANGWLYWAPACVSVRERSIRGTSRLT